MTEQQKEQALFHRLRKISGQSDHVFKLFDSAFKESDDKKLKDLANALNYLSELSLDALDKALDIDLLKLKKEKRV